MAFITADHGEMLGERGLAGHGRSADLYQSVVQVPLVVRAPGVPARGPPRAGLVQLADITQTIASAAGVSDGLPESAARRVDLLSPAAVVGRDCAISEREPLNERSAKAFRRRNPSFDVSPHLCEMMAVVKDGWKLIHRGDRRHELFNLADDPQEHRNLFEAQPNRAQMLLDVVTDWQSSARPHATVDGLSPDEEAIVEKRLQDLGYF
jgi:arylsulfatase A-like enzyme